MRDKMINRDRSRILWFYEIKFVKKSKNNNRNQHTREEFLTFKYLYVYE